MDLAELDHQGSLVYWIFFVYYRFVRFKVNISAVNSFPFFLLFIFVSRIIREISFRRKLPVAFDKTVIEDVVRGFTTLTIKVS